MIIVYSSLHIKELATDRNLAWLGMATSTSSVNSITMLQSERVTTVRIMIFNFLKAFSC